MRNRSMHLIARERSRLIAGSCGEWQCSTIPIEVLLLLGAVRASVVFINCGLLFRAFILERNIVAREGMQSI